MFDLTRQERQVVLFLCGLALCGLGIDFLLKHIPASSAVFSCPPELGKVDLNRADKEALMEVSGIGEKLACRIIEERSSRRGFQSVEELKELKGMTSRRYEQVKESLFVK